MDIEENELSKFHGVDVIRLNKDGTMTGIIFSTFKECPKPFKYHSQLEIYPQLLLQNN